MKSFLRALRYAWTYRARLVVSMACALMAAVLWSLNFTVIYPVLKILTTKQTAQQWIDQRIDEDEEQITKLDPQIQEHRQELRKIDTMADSDFKSKRRRDVVTALARLESQLESTRSDQGLSLIGKRYIDRYLPNDCFQTLAQVFLAVVVAVAVKGFFEFCQDWLVGSVVNLSLFDLRNRFFRNAIHLDVDSFSDQGTSELMARFTNDTEMLGQGLKTLFGKVIAEPLKALSCVVIACVISWQLTLLFLVLVPLAAFVLSRVGRVMRRATRRLLERMSSIYKILQETFQGIRVVKSCTMEPHERRRFRAATRDYCHKAIMVIRIDALADPVIELLAVVAVAGAFMVGAYLVLEQKTHLFDAIKMSEKPLEAASLIMLYGYLAAIADPVRKLSSVYTKLQSACAAADRIFSQMDRQPRVRANSEGLKMEGPRETIEFRDVCFSYEPGRPILTNIHLHIDQGETIALVGKNGCGKTTLVGLIPRFYDCDHGSILVDGADLRAFRLRSLRQRIGIVTQETLLFDDTIHANIAYGLRRAKPEQVEEAAHKAFAHDFITRLPNGYQTRVGEAGSKLSGGQRQRIALARAILRDPSILILDEFTSQYDAESEALIHRALKDFIRGRTTLIITHRLNTLEIANRIVVLEAGRIAAVGTHGELLAGSPAYQRLHEAQFHRRSA